MIIPTIVDSSKDSMEEFIGFDPENFSAENEKSFKKLDNMPFGHGKRMCVGMELGLLNAKLCVLSALKKFRFQKLEEANE